MRPALILRAVLVAVCLLPAAVFAGGIWFPDDGESDLMLDEILADLSGASPAFAQVDPSVTSADIPGLIASMNTPSPQAAIYWDDDWESDRMLDEIATATGDHSPQARIHALPVDSITGHHITAIIAGVAGSQHGGIFWDDDWESDVMLDGILFVSGDLIVAVVP